MRSSRRDRPAASRTFHFLEERESRAEESDVDAVRVLRSAEKKRCAMGEETSAELFVGSGVLQPARCEIG